MDANLLLYASDASSAFHARAVALLERSAAGPEIVHLPWPVVTAYLRIATHPSIFEGLRVRDPFVESEDP